MASSFNRYGNTAEKLQPQRMIGKYRVLACLGEGAMGIVYRARDPEVGRDVAVKILRNSVPGLAQSATDTHKRFRLEARSLGNLRHPNIVTVFEANYQDDCPYIAMDFIEGQTLTEMIKRAGKLPPQATLTYLSEVASGLDYAHSKGVIHRDIKSSNIIIDKQGTPFILDFGIASINLQVAGIDNSILNEGMMGTPAYMAPEQVSQRQIDYRSDLFSLAVVAFEALSGSLPYSGASASEVMENIVQARRHSICGIAPELPPAVEYVFDRALAVLKEDRFSNAKEFIEALRAALRIDSRSIGFNANNRISLQSVGGNGKRQSVLRPDSTNISCRMRLVPPAQEEVDAELLNPWRVIAGDKLHDQEPIRQKRESAPGNLFSNQTIPCTPIRKRLRNSSDMKVKILAVLAVFFLLPAGIFILIANSNSEVKSNDSPSAILMDGEPLADPKIEKPGANTQIMEMTDRQLAGTILDLSNDEPVILRALDTAKIRNISQLPNISSKLLTHPNHRIRVAAIRILGDLQEKRALPALMIALEDPEVAVRIEASKSLQFLGDRRAVGYLTARYLAEKAPEAKVVFRRAIESLNGFPMDDAALTRAMTQPTELAVEAPEAEPVADGE